MYSILLLLGLISGALGQSLVVGNGRCRRPETAQVNTNAFGVSGQDAFGVLGSFFSLYRIPNLLDRGSCTKVTVGIQDPLTGYLNVSERLPSGEEISWAMIVKRYDDYGFLVTNGTDSRVVYVLATDNKTYIILYTCEDTPDDSQKYVFGWVLSRTKELSPAGVAGATAAYMQNSDMRQTTWEVVKQDC